MKRISNCPVQERITKGHIHILAGFRKNLQPRILETPNTKVVSTPLPRFIMLLFDGLLFVVVELILL